MLAEAESVKGHGCENLAAWDGYRGLKEGSESRAG